MQKRIQIFVEGAQPTIVGLLAGCVIVIGLNWSILSAKRAQAAKTLWVSFIYLFDLSWLNYQSFAVRALALTKSQASPYANPNTDNAERYIDVRLGVVCVRVVHGTAQFDEQHFERCWRHYMGRTRCWDRTLRPLGPSGMSWQDGMDGSDRFLAATTHGSLEPKRHWQNHVMLIKFLSFYLCMHAARKKWRVASQNNLAKLLSVQVDPWMLPRPCRTRAVFFLFMKANCILLLAFPRLPVVCSSFSEDSPTFRARQKHTLWRLALGSTHQNKEPQWQIARKWVQNREHSRTTNGFVRMMWSHQHSSAPLGSFSTLHHPFFCKVFGDDIVRPMEIKLLKLLSTSQISTAKSKSPWQHTRFLPLLSQRKAWGQSTWLAASPTRFERE